MHPSLAFSIGSGCRAKYPSDSANTNIIPLTHRGICWPSTVITQPWVSRLSCTMATKKKITPASRLNVVAVIVSRPEFDFSVLGIGDAPRCGLEHTLYADTVRLERWS